jgi:hypothetical protein
MSILLYHYKELTECISEVERIEARVNNSKKKEWLTKKKEEEKQLEKEEVPTTLDSYLRIMQLLIKTSLLFYQTLLYSCCTYPF